jgi:hypothetical protein
MDITSNFFDKFGRKHLWFDLFQQIIKFSAELNFYNFAENIIKKYGRKSQILGGERPPLPPLNREPWAERTLIKLEKTFSIVYVMLIIVR